LRGFLYQTAKNIAADWLRRRIVREAFIDDSLRRGHQENVLTPERICLAQEEVEALERGFELLPPRTRMALILIKEDGLSYEEVGARLGIKTHSARRLIERAMEFLLEAVTQERLITRRKR
jgi:RNA polymerase sigma factor (sigma-70 family)